MKTLYLYTTKKKRTQPQKCGFHKYLFFFFKHLKRLSVQIKYILLVQHFQLVKSNDPLQQQCWDKLKVFCVYSNNTWDGVYLV